MKINEYLSLNGPAGRNVLGFSRLASTPYDVAIGRGDLLFIDHVLSHNLNYRVVVELGTWVGVTSLYLGLAMKMRDGTFHTFDIRDSRVPQSKNAWLNNMYFYPEDVLSVPNERVCQLLSQEQTLAFIDNGNKRHEVTLYAGYLRPGSGFLVHDWNTEIRLDDIKGTLSKYNFVEDYSEIAECLYSHCRFFRREE